MSPTLLPDALPHVGCGLADLAPAYDVLFCDVWGVVHNGFAGHPRAVDALQRFRRRGGVVVLLTNAPAPARNVVARLDALGVPRATFDAVASSGDVTIEAIVAAGCPPLVNIGPPDELDLYREAGRLGPRQPRIAAPGDAELAVAVGTAPEIGPEPEDYDCLLAVLHARDLPMICANPDIVVEAGDRLVYCAGAIAGRYEALGGRVTQAGKPFAPIYDKAFALAAEVIGPFPKSRVLAIGDAMHTDMRGAQAQGIDALFITDGIHRAALHGPDRAAPLEAASLRRFLAGHEAQPMAAMPGLAWLV